MWHLPERASGWRRLVQAGIWAVGLYVGLGAVLQTTGTGVAQSTHAAYVVRVIDGDTIEVQLESGTATVRLMGIDTPETTHPTRPVEFYGPEAAALTETALSGKTVRPHAGRDRGPRGPVRTAAAVRHGAGCGFQRGARAGRVRACGPGISVCTPGGVHRARGCGAIARHRFVGSAWAGVSSRVQRKRPA